jgi:colanic acid/amylovoran biosynthesis glycosyltransferase
MVAECGPAAHDKVHVIYGGVDTDRLSPRPKEPSTGPFQILCVARFEEVKGHTYLVEACRLLRERGIAFQCGLIGDGPWLSKVAAQIELAGLNNSIQLLGARPYPEVIQAFTQADVVVLPTAPTASGKREGIPNVLKEAMACGLPVVASAVGGIPELVDDGISGILLPPKNAAALADALQRLNEYPALRHRLGRGGREKILREFDLKNSVAKRSHLFLYGQCADEAVPSTNILPRTELPETAQQPA